MRAFSTAYQYVKKYLKQLPIRSINFDNPEDVLKHDEIVKLVETMLKLNKDIDTARTPQGKELIQRQIDATDKQIDKLVYELYDLTEEEIKIVEDNINGGN